MVFEKVKAVYDDKGRRSLVPTGEPEQFFECDDVLVAVGQENAFPWIERDAGIEFDRMGHAGARPRSPCSRRCRTCSSAATRPSARRTSSGRWRTATTPPISIDKLCNGEDITSGRRRRRAMMSQKMGIHEWSYDNEIANDLRFTVPWADINKTLKNVKMEVELGFDAATAWKEAQRCLNCDVQTVFTDAAVHRVRRLRRHLPDGLHHLHRAGRGKRPAHAP